MDETIVYEVPTGFIATLRDSSTAELTMLRHQFKRSGPSDQKFLKAVDEEIKRRALERASL